MEQYSQKIELSRIASDSASEVPSMVRELEGLDREESPSDLHWPTRFISAGGKSAPPRWGTRFIAAGPKSAPTRP